MSSEFKVKDQRGKNRRTLYNYLAYPTDPRFIDNARCWGFADTKETALQKSKNYTKIVKAELEQI